MEMCNSSMCQFLLRDFDGSCLNVVSVSFVMAVLSDLGICKQFEIRSVLSVFPLLISCIDLCSTFSYSFI